MAIAGFVISLVSLILFGLTSIIGLVFSALGINKAKKLNGNGNGLAIAGLVISIIGIVPGLLVFISMISFLSAT